MDGRDSREETKIPSLSELDQQWADNPENPRNWTSGRKWTAAGVVSAYNFIAPLASSMMAPALPDIALHYDITSQTLIAMTLSVYILAFAIGPLIFGPLSEIYGRAWVLHFGNLAVVAFSLGCAYAPSANALIGLRFLSGIAASPPVACGGGCIGDLFSERDRSAAMALFTLGPLIRPVIGPIAGGFISQSIGFKWIFIVLAITAGIIALGGIPLLQETYAPVLRARKVKKEFNADPEKLDLEDPAIQEGVSKKIWINLSRAVVLLTTSFICFIFSLYNSLMYGVYYLMFTTFPPLFAETYGFSVGITGLAYLGLGFGFILASVVGAVLNKAFYFKLSERNGGVGKPEMRIPVIIFGSFFVPVGLFWYGWSATAKMHWIMPIIGSGIFAFGFTTTFIPLQLYLVDAFTYSASALAATSVLRSVFGFVFPLFGSQMFEKMGLGGGNSFLGGLCIVIGIPFPIWIYYYGDKIRARSALTRGTS
ncbi:multidrug resistance protein 4 [Mycena capillaripes]|nr:multidrug resistance protein 4 [Mycena capillaripes]